MKRRTVLMFLTAGVLAQAAVAEPSEPLMAGVQALRTAPNYAWTNTTELPGAPFKMAPMRGRADAGGWVVLETESEGKLVQSAALGRERVLGARGGWLSRAEVERLKGNERRTAEDLLNAFTPTDELERLLPLVGGLRRDDDGSYFGALPETTAKELIVAVMKGRAPGGLAPELKAPVGNLRLWLGDGRPLRYMISVTATASLPFGTKEIKRVTTVEIGAVGSTRVEVPTEAKAKLETLRSGRRTTDRRSAPRPDAGADESVARND